MVGNLPDPTRGSRATPPGRGEDPEILTTTEATQATRSRMTFRVLMTSIVILIILFALLYWAFLVNSPAPVTPNA
jgi:hypothetical protein